jgi:hypothetical protein
MMRTQHRIQIVAQLVSPERPPFQLDSQAHLDGTVADLSNSRLLHHLDEVARSTWLPSGSPEHPETLFLWQEVE